jgi:outer membrane protein OmpA-like peptidoglycan-associated protein
LPEREQSFLVYFELAKDFFTDESKVALEKAVAAIKTRASTDVSVIGHADTAGDATENYQLALRRAATVAAALAAEDVDGRIVSVESRGDRDLLIKTARGVPEARNRRVEIVVR